MMFAKDTVDPSLGFWGCPAAVRGCASPSARSAFASVVDHGDSARQLHVGDRRDAIAADHDGVMRQHALRASCWASANAPARVLRRYMSPPSRSPIASVLATTIATTTAT
jgi:hypothetical protein